MAPLTAAMLGIAAMLGCWAAAWRLVRPLIGRDRIAPVGALPPPVRRTLAPPSSAPPRSAPRPAADPPPPAWLFEDDGPCARPRPDSASNTVCFERGAVELGSEPGAVELGLEPGVVEIGDEPATDKTEVLPDELEVGPGPARPQTGPTGTELLSDLRLDLN